MFRVIRVQVPAKKFVRLVNGVHRLLSWDPFRVVASLAYFSVLVVTHVPLRAASSGWRRMQPKNKSGRSHIVLRSRIESTDSFLTLGDAAEPPSPLQIRRPRHRDRSQWQAGLPEFRSDSSTESDSTQPPFLSRMNSRDEGLALTENVK